MNIIFFKSPCKFEVYIIFTNIHEKDSRGPTWVVVRGGSICLSQFNAIFWMSSHLTTSCRSNADYFRPTKSFWRFWTWNMIRGLKVRPKVLTISRIGTYSKVCGVLKQILFRRDEVISLVFVQNPSVLSCSSIFHTSSRRSLDSVSTCVTTSNNGCLASCEVSFIRRISIQHLMTIAILDYTW